MSKYGEWLESIGFKYPTKQKEENNYTSVDGRQTTINPDTPIMLVTYMPQMSETFYETERDAVVDLPKDPRVHWQLLNSQTGEILREPEKIEGTTSRDNKHIHTYQMNGSGNGKTSDDMDHTHQIKNFEVTYDAKHSHDLIPKKFKSLKRKLKKS